ncbi:differentially expressed in FDCP 6 homolog isoform X1 [Carassius carassius]|uniref:differentially expressed in FDCP 6 homolog isoform X1 n=2 Tax=Carassius carassius TaxID=217509 RepID=UPI0028685657|nr:differentially expressed in FDCP 6 homolog isoform X1 [Carassius carassius]XP_059367230.1 differentially expressed in FDCP 6 homolog isoform X1 [Carassius carassius]
MDLQSELLKSIWYAFTSLDVEQSGKVSKSQLKVLSHNLYTALNIPHDPVALEEHFKDNNNGPVSNQGYMPYLNKYILAKATEGTFSKETFDELCWTLTSKKNCKPTIQQGLCSHKDCFKLFCLFNLLSEDCYPLVIIQPELEYLLKKISSAMSVEWNGTLLEELLSQNAALQDGMSVWEFLEHLSAGQLLHVESKEAFSLAVDDVFMEMYHNIIKKGYLLKKGHVRRNWQERWFVLKPSSVIYYVNEDLKEKKGEILLEEGSVVENLPDKEGRRCLFCVKTPIRTYEMSASNVKQRVDWVQAMQTALRLRAEGKSSLHQELKLSRRKQREAFQRSHSNQSSHSEPIAADALQHSDPEQQGETESLEQHIESIIQKQREVEAKRKEEEKQEREKQQAIQRDLERQLEEAKEAKEKLTATLTEMEKEVKQQKKRIHELELTQVKLEEALNAQIHARLEEDTIRHELERQLAEEQKKLAELLLHQSQLETLAVSSQEDCSTISQQTEESSQHNTEEVPVHESTSTVTPPNIQQPEENQSTTTQMLKHWTIQLNRLMKPITPGDKVEHLPVKPTCPRQGQALTSREFIAKVQTGISPEKGNAPNPTATQEEEEQGS